MRFAPFLINPPSAGVHVVVLRVVLAPADQNLSIAAPLKRALEGGHLQVQFQGPLFQAVGTEVSEACPPVSLISRGSPQSGEYLLATIGDDITLDQFLKGRSVGRRKAHGLSRDPAQRVRAGL